MEKYDFSGWATRNDLLCTDGRTIKRDAFKNQNGQTVPLIWGHIIPIPIVYSVMGYWKIVMRAFMPTVVSMTVNPDGSEEAS